MHDSAENQYSLETSDVIVCDTEETGEAEQQNFCCSIMDSVEEISINPSFL